MLSLIVLLLCIIQYFITNAYAFHNSKLMNTVNFKKGHSTESKFELCKFYAERKGGSSDTSTRGGGGSRNTGIRKARVSRSLRDELSSIICDVDIKAVNYPDENLLKATTIVDIDLSADLTYAKVFISVLGNSVEKRQVFVWLCENVGQVKYSLAQRLRHMRRVPDIFFKLSDSQGSADLVSLIDSFTPVEVQDTEEYEFSEEDGNEEEEKK